MGAGRWGRGLGAGRGGRGERDTGETEVEGEGGGLLRMSRRASGPITGACRLGTSLGEGESHLAHYTYSRKS